MGDYCEGAAATTWMTQQNGGGNRGDLTRLLGARLVTSLEVKANARFDEELMKKVTGGDELTYAAKFENEIRFSPTFALWFGANDRPIIPDEDEGFWSRVRCVPFTRVVPKADQDKELKEKLVSPGHASAVLSWLVEGCRAWQAQGIGTCSAVETTTAAYRRDNNQASGFAEECLKFGPNLWARTSDVWGSYKTWAKENNVRFPLAAKALGSRLRKLGVTGGDDNSRVSGHRVWWGIELITLPRWSEADDFAGSASNCHRSPKETQTPSRRGLLESGGFAGNDGIGDAS
jgi:putative DNA primase/helicase